MNLSIYHNYNTQKPSFSSLSKYSPINKEDKTTATKSYCNDTYFFRQPNQFEIMRTHLKNNFPNGTHILDYGCSDGEETYSIAMVIEDINKKEKTPLYTITGHDPSTEIIEMANKGKYKVDSWFTPDSFLSKNEPTDSIQLNSYQESFHKHFKPTGEVEKDVEVYNNIFANQISYKVNKEDFNGVVDFVGGPIEGNIDQIDKIYENKAKPGVIVFRNAWYHILENKTNSSPLGKEEIKNLKTVLKKINNTLDDNGILIVGALGRDHLLKEFKEREGIIDQSPFHKALYECNFVPLKNSAEHPIIDGRISDNIKVYTIWKKVSPKKNKLPKIFDFLNKKPLL